MRDELLRRRRGNVNEIQSATTEEAAAMCRRLAQEEGIFAGTSSGLNVIAALRVAARLGPLATVATIMIDSGLGDLSTGLYQHSGRSPHRSSFAKRPGSGVYGPAGNVFVATTQINCLSDYPGNSWTGNGKNLRHRPRQEVRPKMNLAARSSTDVFALDARPSLVMADVSSGSGPESAAGN
jgi:hypothetical protein